MNANANGSDVRFTGAGGAELSHWVEAWNATARKGIVWVNVSSVPAGVSTIRMWYGNLNAASSSNGNATFELFDDFIGMYLDTNKWQSFNKGTSGSVNVSGGYLVIQGGDNYNRGIKSKIIIPSNEKDVRSKYLIEASSDYGNDGDPIISFFANDTSMGAKFYEPHSYNIDDEDEQITDTVCMYVNDGSDVLHWTNGCRLSENYDSRGKWSELALSRIGNTFYGKMIEDSGQTVSKEWIYYGGYDFDNVNIPVIHANNQLIDVKFDWVFIRKFASPEPSIIVGAEQSVGHVSARAVRDIECQSLSPGCPENVTVTITSNISESLSLREYIPAGWNLTRVLDDADSFRTGTNEWVWFNFSSGTTKTVIYRITMPANASAGTYYINGTISNASGVIAAVSGEKNVSYDIIGYYRSLGNDPCCVETTDLLTAANDWSRNITPPGFTVPITTQQLFALADEWSKELC